VSNFHLQEIQTLQNSLREREVEVRKMEDRIKQLEDENDAMRADLLLWQEQEVKP
jgi:hypothetical protein